MKKVSCIYYLVIYYTQCYVHPQASIRVLVYLYILKSLVDFTGTCSEFIIVPRKSTIRMKSNAAYVD
jgi:hypothetical protein